MPCDHADALVLAYHPGSRKEPRVKWCPRCGSVRVLNVNIDLWIQPAPWLSPTILGDLRQQALVCV